MKTQKKSRMRIVGCVVIAFAVFGCTISGKGSPHLRGVDGATMESQDPVSWLEYGRASLFAKNFQEAEAAFRRALQMNNQYLPAYKHLAISLLYQQRKKEAASVYQQAFQVTENDSEIWTGYGYCLLDLGKESEALKAFQRSIATNSDSFSVVSARLGASALFFRQGNKVAAQREYEEAVKFNPEINQMLEENK
jgi:tetratricopeptide (TPR) repeat protein